MCPGLPLARSLSQDAVLPSKSHACWQDQGLTGCWPEASIPHDLLTGASCGSSTQHGSLLLLSEYKGQGNFCNLTQKSCAIVLAVPYSLDTRHEVQPTHQGGGLETRKWALWGTEMPSTTASRMPLGRPTRGARGWLGGCLTVPSLMSLPLMVRASRCQDGGSEVEREVYIIQSGS